ncbi:MAG: TetR/AcrR family transcriptional regulator [Peptococcaceae bacterium]|nr:TetR/AcrR family transcriptional regulator [Peptococcaceae bacterium]
MKNRIIEGFERIAGKRGFYKATVDELSSSTGISKRTIYKYFRSKDEIVWAVIEKKMGFIKSELDKALLEENPVDILVSFTDTIANSLNVITPQMMKDIKTYYPEIWNKIESFRTEKMHKLVFKIIGENKEGYFREISPEIFITALQAAIREVVEPKFILNHGLTADKAIISLLEIFFCGIFTIKGELMNKKITGG